MCEIDDACLLGLMLKQAREEYGLTQEYVANTAGITERHLARIENGTRQPSVPLLRKLVAIINLSVEQYFHPDKPVQKSTLDRQLEALLSKLADRDKKAITAMIYALVKEREAEMT